jgi:hypothetical protein
MAPGVLRALSHSGRPGYTEKSTMSASDHSPQPKDQQRLDHIFRQVVRVDRLAHVQAAKEDFAKHKGMAEQIKTTFTGRGPVVARERSPQGPRAMIKNSEDAAEVYRLYMVRAMDALQSELTELYTLAQRICPDCFMALPTLASLHEKKPSELSDEFEKAYRVFLTTAPAPPSPTRRIPDWEELLFSSIQTAAQIAEKLGEPVDLVERSLRNFRQQHSYGFIEDHEHGVGESRFKYKIDDILIHLRKWYDKRQKKKARNVGTGES